MPANVETVPCHELNKQIISGRSTAVEFTVVDGCVHMEIRCMFLFGTLAISESSVELCNYICNFSGLGKNL